MIGRLNHVAIAVPDLVVAAANYRDTLGAKISDPLELPNHGVTTILLNSQTLNLSCCIRWATIHRSKNSWKKSRRRHASYLL